MTTTPLRPRRPSGAAAPHTEPERRGPFARIVVAALVTGAVAAAALVLGAYPGAPEHVTTGIALLGFASGWAMLGALTTRMTSSPQRWAYGLAAFLGVSGLALVTLAPGDDGLTAAAWVWPPALLLLLTWSARRMRAAMPGRSRWLLYPVFGALFLASVGALVQNVTARDAMAMPGALYDVGSHRLHLNCTGTGAPTVVLESGLGGSSPMWARVTSGTARTTRVCAYDRAGTGWSDDAPRPQDGLAVVDDLHRLLAVAGETGPYVLVGHSTGGVYAMTYAAQHPEQVAGMVLLDSASPRQFTVLPEYATQYSMMTRLYGVLPTLTRLGASRLAPALFSNEVPGEAGRHARAFAADPRSARTARDELSTYRRTFAQAQTLTTLGSKPLIVVAAGDTLSGTPGWPAAQAELAALSSNARRRSVDSTHGGVLDDPIASAVSVAAITDVIRAVRTGTPVGTA
ncbi:MAG TPA: alpha/beta fold hydrolase [Frankiaceae bacterium]|nr:alpha/beta fold hydrolase [Frankiaceae bacterium]